MNNDVDEPQELNGFAKFGLLMTKIIIGGYIVYNLYTGIRDCKGAYQETFMEKVVDNGISLFFLSIGACFFYWMFLLYAEDAYRYMLKVSGVSERPDGWQCVWIVCFLLILLALFLM